MGHTVEEIPHDNLSPKAGSHPKKDGAAACSMKNGIAMKLLTSSPQLGGSEE